MGLRILQLTKKFPYPLKDGESIAIHNLSKAMVELGCEVTLLSMNTTKHYTDTNIALKHLSHYNEIHSVQIDNRVKWHSALLNLFSQYPYHVTRFISKEFESAIIRVLSESEFDIIQLETLYLTPYIPIIRKYTDAKICMRAHNIEYEIWERYIANEGFSIKRAYLTHLTKKLKHYELHHLNDYDLLISVSKRDMKKFKTMGYLNGAVNSPIGLKLDRYSSSISKKDDLFHICFIGAMDWLPNKEGLDWFLKKVWPLFNERNPDSRFHIAGRNMEIDTIENGDETILIHGEVENARKFISSSDVMVVPLFSGSGTRVKILEGMALGKPVVSTCLGLEGIEARDGKEIIVADSPLDFIQELEKLKNSIELREKIGRKARKFVHRNYDAVQNALELKQIYDHMVKGEYSLLAK